MVDVCLAAMEAVSEYDLLFTLLYLLDDNERVFRLAGVTGVAAETRASRHDSAWPVAEAIDSSRLPLDDSYRSFYDLVASQVGTAIGHAHAYAEERRRADAEAELDRAKTTFFSNGTHEVRTR